MEEIELKLSLSPEDVAAFRNAAPLAGLRARRRKLTSIYYDTPDHALARAGMALRLRKVGRGWVQTLKGGGGATGGLHARGEWEVARSEPTIDLASLSQTPFAAIADRGLAARLVPAFTVAFERETWEVEPAPGTRLEVALDRGEANAGARKDAVCEVEIELMEGETDAAFELAHSLVNDVPLRPSPVTKAQRGYRLLSGSAPQPVRSRRIALDAAMTPRAAARAIVAAALEHLQANEEGVIAGYEPEFVHQARVALRRLRSALRLFRGVLDAELTERWRAELGDVARALGAARDWDVFATETLPALSEAFGDPELAKRLARRAADRRRLERRKARAALSSSAYGHLVLEISRWLAQPADDLDDAGTSLPDFAERLVRKRHKRLVRDARHFAERSPEERHSVRIDAKRLRYCVDDFASIFKERRVGAYLDRLARLQDILGRANDARTATALIVEVDAPSTYAEFARGWFAARTAGDVGEAARVLSEIAHAKRF